MAKDKGFPQCEKLRDVKSQLDAIRNFILFLSEEGFSITDNNSNYQTTIHEQQIEDLMMRCYKIDMVQVEMERRRMLEELTNA
jgi:hypothetical protein